MVLSSSYENHVAQPAANDDLLQLSQSLIHLFESTVVEANSVAVRRHPDTFRALWWMTDCTGRTLQPADRRGSLLVPRSLVPHLPPHRSRCLRPALTKPSFRLRPGRRPGCPAPRPGPQPPRPAAVVRRDRGLAGARVRAERHGSVAVALQQYGPLAVLRRARRGRPAPERGPAGWHCRVRRERCPHVRVTKLYAGPCGLPACAACRTASTLARVASSSTKSSARSRCARGFQAAN
jgi:hypothetical protein